MIGKTILHYKIIEKLGEGGMGIVYLAEDAKLKRQVAIKFLPGHIAANSDERKRFEIEAQAAAALNHPNIATIHAIEETEENLFLVMEYISGKHLKNHINATPLAMEEAVDIAVQIARGLQAAHEKGIIHRDIKSTNIMVTDKGDIKIMDFGLAKFRGSAQLTQIGTTVGTAAYMSPEQAKGEEADLKADIWSFGVVLYEMLTGTLPFKGDYEQAVIYAILNEEAKWDAFPDDVPEDLKKIVQKTLKKNPGERYLDTTVLLNDLKLLVGSSQYITIAGSDRKNIRDSVLKPIVFIPLILIILTVTFLGYKYYIYQKNFNRAREVVLPHIEKLADDMAWTGEGLESWKAFKLSKQASEYLAGDPSFERIQSKYCIYTRFNTQPAGADVYIKPYGRPDTAWTYLGQTPIDSIRLPISFLRLKIEKPGYALLEDNIWIWVSIKGYRYSLAKTGEIPPEMVRVEGNEQLGDFLMDRYEVANRQYKQFVDSGGYKDKKYWKFEFIKDNKKIPWQEAMNQFTDKTGINGPATWEVGDFPAGRDNYPVAGISWYEAAAYAEWAGKSLPTIHHWQYVAQYFHSAEIVPLSNLNGTATKEVGSSNSMSRFGTYDMAGNVREWCWSALADNNERAILGGGWNDADYIFTSPWYQPPMDRSVTNGIRCIQYLDSSSTNREKLLATIKYNTRDFTDAKPVPDEKFRDYLEFYKYDKKPLNEKIEGQEIRENEWIKQAVDIDAAYNNEILPLYIFFPVNARPPFQTVIYFPGSGSMESHTSKHLRDFRQVDFFLKSGRAVVYPVYKGTYERFVNENLGSYSVSQRDLFVKWVQDYSRTIDYLETREDIDHDKLIYYGFSMGGFAGPLVLATEKRLKAAILYVAGIPAMKVFPEVSTINFAPRVKLPVLMLNGRLDATYPYDTSQKPLYNLLGTPEPDKKWIVYDNGHSVPRQELIKESLSWLDKYLGPVQ